MTCPPMCCDSILFKFIFTSIIDPVDSCIIRHQRVDSSLNFAVVFFQCPVDTRRALAENILVMGGTALLPGFKHRLMKELEDLIAKPYYTERLKVRNFKMHTPPGKENYIAWLGGKYHHYFPYHS